MNQALTLWIFFIGVLTLLTGCGGGGSDNSSAPEPMPTVAPPPAPEPVEELRWALALEPTSCRSHRHHIQSAVLARR